MAFPILQTTNLSDIYPDISGQLCNKHVKRLSHLKTMFSQIYDELQPEGYVFINGVAKVVELGNDLLLNFALENGVTVLFAKTYKNQDIYINGNHIEEEIIFDAKGKHQDGIHQKIHQIKQIIKAIRKYSGKGKQFYGGIIYVHSNIGEELFAFNECFIIGLTLALLLIHQSLQDYNIQRLVDLITNADTNISKKVVSKIVQKYEMYKMIVQSCFTNKKQPKQLEIDYDLLLCDPRSLKSLETDGTIESKELIINSQEKLISKKENLNSYNTISCLLSHGELQKEEHRLLQINLKADHKLIFCKLDLSKEQLQEYNSKMSRIKVISSMLEQHHLHKMDLLDQENDVIVPQAFKNLLKEDDFQLIKYYEESRNLLNNLANGVIQFDEFITQKHILDTDYEIHDSQIIDLLDELHKKTRYLQHFCIIEGTILLISMDRQYYAQIMIYLRNLLNNHKLSTFKYLESVKRMQCESRYDDISEIMFTAMPSVGCAVYQPNESTWI